VADFCISWDTCQDTNFLYELMEKNLEKIYELHTRHRLNK
jgi:hypothetical protein